LPDFTPERQDFYRTVHLGQGGRLGDGPAKPSQQQQTAEDERDQGEHRFQSWLQGGHVPGHSGSLCPLPKNGGNSRSTTRERGERACLAPLLLGQCLKHPALPGDEGGMAGGWSGRMAYFERGLQEGAQVGSILGVMGQALLHRGLAFLAFQQHLIQRNA
jgi:hypothetical protein